MRHGLAIACAGLALAAAPLGADEAQLKATARSTLSRAAPAVITVRLTLKTRVVYQGRERNTSEGTLEIAGTVLSAAGLTVVSDFTSNPTAMLPSQPEGPKFETETTDVKLVLRDGRELPAKFVLRDADLDLAFVMPAETGLNLPHVDLDASSVPEPLDDLVFLYPMGKTLNREVAVALGKVRAVVRKPRTFVVSDLLSGLQSLGCPAFNEAGRAVGLVVLRRSPAAPSGPGSLREMLDMMTPVVLTAESVLQVAAQVAKPPAGP